MFTRVISSFKSFVCCNIYGHVTAVYIVVYRGNSTDTLNRTTTPPVTTTKLPPTTVAPIEEKPESPEVEQHSSMTIFFILLVVGMTHVLF